MCLFGIVVVLLRCLIVLGIELLEEPGLLCFVDAELAGLTVDRASTLHGEHRLVLVDDFRFRQELCHGCGIRALHIRLIDHRKSA